MNAFELYNEHGKPTGVWCCGKCRKLTLSPAWTPSSEDPKSTKEAADECCMPPKCSTCGGDRQPGYERECSTCRSKRWNAESAERLAKRIEKAEDVTGNYEGPVYIEGGRGDMGEGFYSSIEYAIDSVLDSEDDEKWAFTCTSRVEKLCIGNAIEHLCYDGYEDMADNLQIPDSLAAAVDEFNRINEKALTVWDVDYSRKINLGVSG